MDSTQVDSKRGFTRRELPTQIQFSIEKLPQNVNHHRMMDGMRAKMSGELDNTSPAPQHVRRNLVSLNPIHDVHVIRMFKPKTFYDDEDVLSSDQNIMRHDDHLNDFESDAPVSTSRVPLIITTQPSNPEEENSPLDGIDDILSFPNDVKDGKRDDGADQVSEDEDVSSRSQEKKDADQEMPRRSDVPLIDS